MKSFLCPPWGLPNRSRRPPEPKKIHCYLPGGLRENFPASFHPPRGVRKAIWPPCWSPLGAPFGLFFELWGENLEILILTDSLSENLDFQGSGGLPGLIFEV